MNLDVVVLGSVNADLVIAVPRRPAAGETITGGDLQVLPGGKGANQAVAAARLGAQVAFIGCVGSDAYAALLRGSLAQAGVDLRHLRITPGASGTAVIFLDPDGDNSIVISPGANGLVGPQDVESAIAMLRAARVLVLQREIDPEVSAAAATIVRTAGGRVLLSLAPSGPVPQALLRVANPLLVNEQEARDLLQDRDIHAILDGTEADINALTGESLARAVRETGVLSAVVTLGAAGAVAAGPWGVITVPAERVEPVDTTGAGDALAGALAHRLAAGDDLPQALRFAVRVAAISVTRPGAQPSYPTAAEMLDPRPADT